MQSELSAWMSWEGGVDLVACTAPALAAPNVIVHVARLVHTPHGSAAAGMLFYQPDPAAAPLAVGFVSPDTGKIGSYFGPAIFAGTPFGQAPAIAARIEIEIGADTVGATVTAAGHQFRTRLSGLAPLSLVNRPPAPMTPFWQQGLERAAARAQLWVDGREIPLVLPPAGITGGPAAVHAPCGLYAR
jgi:hypothetical protein